MKNKAVVCLVCGSSLVEKIKANDSAQLTLGPEFTFEEIYYKCKSCGEEADFFCETDKNYLVAQKKAQADFVKGTINDLSNLGMGMAFLERVFELPIRTLTRWKNGDFSSSAIALLRILKTYHWIADVAEHKFEPSFAKQAVVDAWKVIESNMVEQQNGAGMAFNIIKFGETGSP